MTMGIMTMPGRAIPTRLATTIEMPCRAAVFDWPIFSPSAVSSMIPGDGDGGADGGGGGDGDGDG